MKDKQTFEKELEVHGKFTYTNVGISMMPLLRQHRDLFTVVKKGNERCKKYDMVLFRRKNGQYVLHRILKVRSKDYVLCGDHQFHRETGITDEDIIGVVTEVIRGDRVISITNKIYRLYVHLWCDFFHIRAFILWGKVKLRKLHRMKKEGEER